MMAFLSRPKPVPNKLVEAPRMFELPPYTACPVCDAEASFGVLAVGGLNLRRRCKHCRHSANFSLPKPNKRVIYLDQFAISEVFKVRRGVRRAGATLGSFWESAAEKIERAVAFQQAVIPISNIHSEETQLFRSANDLRIAHEMFGDVRLKSWRQILDDQEIELFEAFLHGGVPPVPSGCVDVILESERNTWLPQLHITISEGASPIASLLRAEKDSKGESLKRLWKTWVDNKQGFSEVLEVEFSSLPSVNADRRRTEFGYRLLCEEMERQALEVSHERGSPSRIVVEYWQSEYIREVPTHKISSYLFAALARRALNNQRKIPSGSFFSDVSMIAAYAPFVDAMFIDRECFSLLDEVKKNLPIKARLFCAGNSESFLKYLDEVCSLASLEVRRLATSLYGVS